jgi:ABC-2 type transport system permease protein
MNLRKTWAVARREFGSYFVSPTVYAVLFVYLFLTGYYSMNRIVAQQQADLNISLYLFILVFIVPMLTMRLIASERREGTIEMIFTSPIRASEFVVGKFLGVLSVYGVILLLSLFYPLYLLWVGEPDPFMFGAQYLGLVLIGGMYLAVGLFCSSLTENHIVAAISTFFLLIFMLAISILKSMVPRYLGTAVDAFDLSARMQNFQEGLVHLTDVTYFLSLIAVFLYLTIQYLNARSWEQ